jgi:hypothetical protein
MNKTLLIFACTLLSISTRLLPPTIAVVTPMMVVAQNRLPLLGEIGDLKGKAKFFLTTEQDKKTIIKTLTGHKGGLIEVETADTADFFVEFTLNKQELKLPQVSSTSTRYEFFETGRLVVYYLREGKKVIVYDKRAKKSNKIFLPSSALAKDFVNELSK